MHNSDFIIEINFSIIDAMRKIDLNAKGIVYICKNQKLVGVLTDGDIRRYILRGGDLKKPLSEISNHLPKYLYSEQKKEAPNVMDKYHIQSIPIVNKEMEIVEIEFLYDKKVEEKHELNLPVVIMAGGKGTRLYPYTQILPKPLIPIGDKAITEHIMDHFSDYGCTHFVMIVNYKKNFIKAYFGDSENQRDISFVEEDKFLGTGGGLKLLEGKYSSTFFMSNCDILIEEDYSKILRYHQKQKNIITMVCALKQITVPYGTVEVQETGQVMRLNEKPKMSFITNTGFYVLEPDFLKEIPQDTFVHITDVIQKCIDEGKRVGVYPISEENWLDMGQLDELEHMKKHLKV